MADKKLTTDELLRAVKGYEKEVIAVMNSIHKRLENMMDESCTDFMDNQERFPSDTDIKEYFSDSVSDSKPFFESTEKLVQAVVENRGRTLLIEALQNKDYVHPNNK
jgi:hypothetical protein